jgi:addiction module RelE/StbE family toxin
MKIRWTEGAAGNLDQVEEYIARDNPPSAGATVRKIIEAAQMLADYPTIGKRCRERGTRELVVAGLPFIIIYVVQPEELVIIRVLHTAMKYP